MGRIVTLALGVCLSAGCGTLTEQHSRCGFHFEILKPPVIDTTTPILIQTGQPITGAHPMGTLAGPVVEGKSAHAPVAPLAPGGMVGPVLPRRDAFIGDCGPSVQRGLSVEEWCQLMKQMTARPLPAQE